MASDLAKTGSSDKPQAPNVDPPTTKVAFEETVEKSVSSLLHEQAGVSASSLPVPANVYGGAAFSPILFHTPTFLSWWLTCGQAYVRLFLNHFIQTCLIIGLAQMDAWQRDTIDGGDDATKSNAKNCWKPQWWFFLPCAWIYVAAIMKEIAETVDMIELIMFRVPLLPGKSQPLQYRKGEDGSLTLDGGGMSKARKIGVFVFIILPRFVIALAMLVIGCSFLNTANGNVDLLFNCLAVNFILDSDELIFAFLTPSQTRRTIESIPPFEKEELSPLADLMMQSSMVFKLLGSLIIVAILYVAHPECDLDPCLYSDALNRTCPVLAMPFEK